MTDSTGDPSGTGEDGVKENIRARKTWVRLIYMIVMAVAWNIGVFVFWAVAILQFLTKLITGDSNPNLRRFGRQLAEFFAQTARFETFDTETVPFPFATWPSGDEEGPPVPADDLPEASPAKSKRKGPARLRARAKPKMQTPTELKPVENDGPAPDDKRPTSDVDPTN